MPLLLNNNIINKITYNNNVGYTIVGSPTINNNIASNFSNGNYIRLQSNIPIITCFEENVKFKIIQDCAGKSLLSYSTTYNSNNLEGNINISSNLDSINVFLFIKYDGTYEEYSVQYNFSQHLNKYFTFKVYTDLSNVYLYLYDENNILVGTNTYTNINLAGIIDSNKILIGNIYNESDYWPSEIDLNNTYIKFNGVTWFNGKQTASTDLNYVIQNNGSVGYEIVGNPTITDGVVSNFSDSDYIICNQSIAQTSNIEFNVKFNFVSLSATNPLLKGSNQYQQMLIRTSGNLACSFGYQDGGYQTIVSQYTFAINTTYTVNLSVKNNQYTLKIYDNNMQLLETETGIFNYPYLATNSMKIGVGDDNTFCSGTIDINETYVKVNDNYWFNGNSKLLWTDNNIYLQNLTGGGSGSGFGYIDAGFKPTNKTTFEFSFTKKDTSGSQINTSPFFVGGCTRDGITYNPFGVNFQNSAFSYFDYVFSMSYTEYDENKVYSTEISNGNYIYKENGVQISSTSLQSNQTCAENLYIGCWDYCYDFGTHIPYYPMLGNLNYIKFWEDGILIRHFVPVPANFVVGGGYKTPSAGMFDIVEQKFYPNLGTDSFTYGKD